MDLTAGVYSATIWEIEGLSMDTIRVFVCTVVDGVTNAAR